MQSVILTRGVMVMSSKIWFGLLSVVFLSSCVEITGGPKAAHSKEDWNKDDWDGIQRGLYERSTKDYKTRFLTQYYQWLGMVHNYMNIRIYRVQR